MSRKPDRIVPTDLPQIPAKRRLDRTGRTLEAALQLMADGKNWGHGMRRRHRPDGSVAYCALGAIDAVTTQGPFAMRHRRQAVQRLASVIPHGLVHDLEFTVFTWNDYGGGWNRVREGFERAIVASQKR